MKRKRLTERQKVKIRLHGLCVLLRIMGPDPNACICGNHSRPKGAR